MRTTEGLIKSIEAQGVKVVDRRGDFDPHPTARYARRELDQIVFVTWHHTAGPTINEDAPERVWNYHRNNPLPSGSEREGAAYWACLCEGSDGTDLHVFHDATVATWSQGYAQEPGDENMRGLGIVVAGSYVGPHNPDGTKASAHLLDTVRKITTGVMRWMQVASWIDNGGERFPAHRITGHFDYGKAACPGAQIEQLVRQMRGEGTSAPYTLTTWRNRQAALEKVGIDPGTIDGIYGRKTGAAIRELTTAAGLYPTNRWGRGARGALIESMLRAGEPTAVGRMVAGTTTNDARAWLVEHELPEIEGICGKNSEAAKNIVRAIKALSQGNSP